ncbi:hypothetical protein [Falsiroseomonas sp. CW058]|uniref:hypothetical protein n=1 Tax=Falsiroseomonas sp. CW058 TaxID=3388664 RepID=UPI003D31D447
MADAAKTTDPRMLRRAALEDAIAAVEAVQAAPDGYYYAQDRQKIIGWERATGRVLGKLREMLADD